MEKIFWRREGDRIQKEDVFESYYFEQYLTSFRENTTDDPRFQGFQSKLGNQRPGVMSLVRARK